MHLFAGSHGHVDKQMLCIPSEPTHVVLGTSPGGHELYLKGCDIKKRVKKKKRQYFLSYSPITVYGLNTVSSLMNHNKVSITALNNQTVNVV